MENNFWLKETIVTINFMSNVIYELHGIKSNNIMYIILLLGTLYSN